MEPLVVSDGYACHRIYDKWVPDRMDFFNPIFWEAPCGTIGGVPTDSRDTWDSGTIEAAIALYRLTMGPGAHPEDIFPQETIVKPYEFFVEGITSAGGWHPAGMFCASVMYDFWSKPSAVWIMDAPLFMSCRQLFRGSVLRRPL